MAPYWPNRTWFPELMLLAIAPPWQIPLRRDLLSQRGGTLRHPRPDLWNLHVWDAEVLVWLPPEVVNTIISARAPSTRHAYRLNWNLYIDLCSSRQENPRRCPIRVVISFFKMGWSEGCLPPPSKFMLPLSLHNTMQLTVSLWGSMTWSSGSSEGRGG